ncbi:MAG: SDR family NAD(P)-dependent oxidoreductase [Planctomycetes bacterium]|nr:SDR family NAD(P)-dependent oxidoreductase [Planctomycetota bacterium]
MSAQFGTWIGSGAAGTWKPQIDPRLVDDPRFPALLASAADGVSFAGAVALVTGASDPNSIGYAIARNLASGGAKVVITGSRDLPRIIATAEQLAREAGAGAVLPAQVNQGDFAQLDALLEHIKGQGLAFTHLFPFAAVNHPALFVGIKPEDYARVFSVNVFGVYHLVGKHARQAPRGTPWYVVVPLSPNDGRLQGSGLYPATKQALIPIVVQGQNEVGDRRNGHYLGVSIAWTRSALMSQLDAGVEAARAQGLKVFETRDTADVCTLCGTTGAQALKGTTIDAAGGFGKVDAKAMGKVFAAH